MMTDYNEMLDTLQEMYKDRDSGHNLESTGRFLKLMADVEHDDPEQAPAFKRDQHLTEAALFKAKALAIAEQEARALRNENNDSAARACEFLIRRIREIPL